MTQYTVTRFIKIQVRLLALNQLTALLALQNNFFTLLLETNTLAKHTPAHNLTVQLVQLL